MKHFHIWWTTDKKAYFDYDSFTTEEEARHLANGIKRFAESFEIIEVEGPCSLNCLAYQPNAKPSRRKGIGLA